MSILANIGGITLALLTPLAAGRAEPGTLHIPARVLPLPEMASPQLRALIAHPPSLQDQVADIPLMEKRLRVHVRSRVVGGVPCFDMMPDLLPVQNRGRLLMHLHGGAYVGFGGQAGIAEAVLLAGLGRFHVLSVDYRLAPRFPYPAAIYDAFAVWKALIRERDPSAMAVFGTSAGGAMTLALVQRSLAQHVPIPAAIAVGSPWADLSKGGDSLNTNAGVDGMLGSADGPLEQAAQSYAAGLGLKDPRVSPLYGSFAGFPPVILTAGTRDLFLSNTVLTYRKLRDAKIEAQLQIYEGMSHAQYLLSDRTPETLAAFSEISDFFERNLRR